MDTNVSIKDLKVILESYKSWKILNINMSAFASRSINFPEAISESLCCYKLGYIWHNKANIKTTGDATGPQNKLVEIKATSVFTSDLTSFSPDTHFDILIFARLKLSEDKLYIYNMNMNYSQFQNIQINRKETVFDQQKQGKRPRLSLIKLINEKCIKPIDILDLKELAAKLNITL